MTLKHPVAEWSLTGSLIKNWESASQAAKAYGYKTGEHILRCCRANSQGPSRRTTYNRYWTFCGNKLPKSIVPDLARKHPEATEYSVSPDGQIYNNVRNTKLKQSVDINGYRYFDIPINSKRTRLYTHRLVARLFNQKKKYCNIVNHKNGNKQDNNAHNLEWVTKRQDVMHMYSTGLNANCKQTIRRNIKNGNVETYYSLGEACRQLKKSRYNFKTKYYYISKAIKEKRIFEGYLWAYL